MPQKEILNWKSKIQYRKGTPYISLIKHLSKRLEKGKDIECKLMIINNEIKVVIDVD